ncbi:MAG: hypothetical protein IIW71_00005 [Treponema sp.]|nr:hypothetical protein [Treponema sp.]
MNKMKTETYVSALEEAGFVFELSETGFNTNKGVFKIRVNINASVIAGENFDTTKLKILNWCAGKQVHAIREGNYFYMDWVS